MSRRLMEAMALGLALSAVAVVSVTGATQDASRRMRIESVSPRGVGLPPLEGPHRQAVAVDGRDGVHTVFVGVAPYEKAVAIYFNRRVGEAWDEGRRLSAPGSAVDSPVVFADGSSRVHVAWMGSSDRKVWDVHYVRSADGGATWSAPRLFPAGTSRAGPQIAGDAQGNVYICFATAGERAPNARICLHRSPDGGESWSPADVDFPDPRGPSSSACILVEEGKIWLTWNGETGGGIATLVNRSTDGGKSWLDRPVTVNDDLTVSTSAPRLCRLRDRWLVFWKVRRAGGPVQLYMDQSVDGGKDWGKDAIILNRDVTEITYQVAVLDDNCILTWSDDQPGRMHGERLFHQMILQDDHSPTPPATEIMFAQGDGTVLISDWDIVVKDGRGYWAALLSMYPRREKLILGWGRGGALAQERIELGTSAPSEEWSSLRLIPAPDGVGFFYRKAARRWLPMQSVFGGELSFGRWKVSQ